MKRPDMAPSNVHQISRTLCSLALFGSCSAFPAYGCAIAQIYNSSGGVVLATSRGDSSELVVVDRGNKQDFEVNVSADASSDLNLRTASSSLTVSLSGDDNRMKFRRIVGNKWQSFAFKIDRARHRFDLIQVSTVDKKNEYLDREEAQLLSGDDDDKSIPAKCSSENSLVKNAQIAQQASLAANIESKSVFDASCASVKNNLSKSLAELLASPLGADGREITCISKYKKYQTNVTTLHGYLVFPYDHMFTCERSAKSHFDGNRMIVFGADISDEKNDEIRKRKVLHEMLHLSQVSSEAEVSDLVNCCSFPEDKNACGTISLRSEFDKTVDGYPAFQTIYEKILSSSMPESRKRSFLSLAREALDKVKDLGEKFQDSDFVLADKSLALICKSALNDRSCDLLGRPSSQQITDQRKYIRSSYIRYNGVRLVDLSDKVGAAAAANSDAGPIVPQKLTYKPGDEQSLKSVEDTLDRYHKPMAVASDYAGQIGDTVAASWGGTANAATGSVLPRKISNDEYATDVVAVNPKTGVTTLDLGTNAQGQHLTGEAWIPFHGNQFDPPHVEIRDSATGAVVSSIGGSAPVGSKKVAFASTSSGLGASDTGATSATKPSRILKPGQLPRARGSSDLASSAQVDPSGGSQQSSGGVGLPSAGAQRATGSPANSSTRDTASNHTELIPEPTLKRILFRTRYDDHQALQAMVDHHKAEFQKYSLSIIYCHESYPRGFVGKTQINLDANHLDQIQNCEPLK